MEEAAVVQVFGVVEPHGLKVGEWEDLRKSLSRPGANEGAALLARS